MKSGSKFETSVGDFYFKYNDNLIYFNFVQNFQNAKLVFTRSNILWFFMKNMIMTYHTKSSKMCPFDSVFKEKSNDTNDTYF